MGINIKKKFVEAECERFRRECNFTNDEMAIFNLRVKNMTIAEIFYRLNEQGIPMSESTINRRIRDIKEKIYKVM